MGTCMAAQDVVLMSDSCDACGYKSSEVKGGGAISDRGRAITLHVSEQDDLRRDVIKADSASVHCPPPSTDPLLHLLPHVTEFTSDWTRNGTPLA